MEFPYYSYHTNHIVWEFFVPAFTQKGFILLNELIINLLILNNILQHQFFLTMAWSLAMELRSSATHFELSNAKNGQNWKKIPSQNGT